MKQTTIIVFFVFLFSIWGCGYSTDKKEKLKEELREEIKAELKEEEKEETAETTESQNEELSPGTTEMQENKPVESAIGNVETLKPGTYKVKVRFSKVIAATDGAFYVFENVHGQDFHFYSASETTGLEFTRGIMPMEETPAKYDDIWFDVVFEQREKDFYHGGSGTDIKRDVFVALEVSQTDIQPSLESNSPAFSAGDLKISQFFGTEPFWSMKFLDYHLKKTSPSGEVRFYYLKNGQAGSHKLADVIEPVSSDAIKIEITDESEGAAGVITITRKVCDDGMSDNEYPYTISFVWKEDGRDLNGCGDIKQYP